MLEYERVLAGLELLLLRDRRLLHLLGIGLGPLVQDADRAVLADPVGDLGRVDPHRQLAREQMVKHGRQEADVRAGLSDNRVHFAVDAQTTVARAAIGTVGEPVIPVTPSEHVGQRRFEQL